VIGALVDAVEPWRWLSPFTQAIGEGPVSDTVPLGLAWLAVAAVAFLVAALPVFGRRDLGTA
jgi:ABC-2 type transport system permease protein